MKNVKLPPEETGTVKTNINGNGNNGNESTVTQYKECLFPLTDLLLTNLADIFSIDIDTDNVIDNELCSFIRAVLGY